MNQLGAFSGEPSNTKLKLSDLNPHLMCVLCGGYYIDATTIVECLHSFCRSCIVKHLESSKYCPICEVQVHKTKPLINIRPDKTLQDIVYKLVPGLFASEMRNRRRFYRERPHYVKPNNLESIGEVWEDGKVYVNDENITFSLVYQAESVTTNDVGDSYREILAPIKIEKRYFKCPTGVTIYHLKKLLKTKYDLNDSNYKVEVYLKDQLLRDDLTLLDISYIYLWKSPKGNLDLTYKIFENVVKRRKLEDKKIKNNLEGTKKQCKDLLVRVDSLPKNTEIKEESLVETFARTEKEKNIQEQGLEFNEKSKEKSTTSTAVPPSQPAVQQTSAAPKQETHGNGALVCRSIKENGVAGSDSREVQLQISESGVMIVSQVSDGKIVRTMEDAPAKVMNSQLITGLSASKQASDVGGTGGVEKGKEDPKIEAKAVSRPEPVPVTAAETARPQPPPKPPSKPIKPYKTIRCSPKTWHPVIPKEKLRPTLMKNTEEPKKPLKFFKMRNMPRFLGNPSSGVKPMFAEPGENAGGKDEKKKGHEAEQSALDQQVQALQQREKKTEAAKTKILKIDPKTLRPIEREEVKGTPSVPNLMTNPFIPNNNHFLFSDLHLLPANSGNFSNFKSGGLGGTADKQANIGGFKLNAANGNYSPICFPSPDHNPGFYPFSNLTKPLSFPFPVPEKMDPLLRASRLSPFGNLSGFNVAGFHASLPPSISRLLNPHQHFRKVNQNADKKRKNESTKETSKTIKNCDDSIKTCKGNEGIVENKARGEGVEEKTAEKKGGGENEDSHLEAKREGDGGKTKVEEEKKDGVETVAARGNEEDKGEDRLRRWEEEEKEGERGGEGGKSEADGGESKEETAGGKRSESNESASKAVDKSNDNLGRGESMNN